ncbi:amidase [Paractinoplanes rishiriensis]|uniref:Amidase n=1 Tax=Paractinoplanes rishiriensis TaxID=1050105 RepID=A0A919JTH2_9ACTN|nr:amidase [Actinoplanes rishiriensis]GIE93072.1 amidase [Actinoplanes rishiriensis]
MANADLTRLDLVAAATAVRSREVSPVDLTEAYLDRILDVEPGLNAYVTVTAERAREDARRAEREIAGGHYRGPLHGLPIGLKDLFDTAGIRTTAGSALRREHVPAADCVVASRLHAAGAVLLGKHATHEFAWGGTTNNPHFGPTRNPHDPDRIPGGSSGGSAAAVVARTALAGVGTDTCGSVRIPAALCGCVGLKPTFGRIDLTGVVPLAPSLDHAGPIARTVPDAALLLGALAAEPVEPVDRDPAGLRVGVLRGWFDAILDGAVRAALAGRVSALTGLGVLVDEVPFPDEGSLADGSLVDDVFDIVLAEAGAYHRADFARAPDAYGQDLRTNLSLPAPSADRLAAGAKRLSARVARLTAALRDFDVLLCATVPAPAPPIGAEVVEVDGRQLPIEWMLTRLTSIFDVAGLPALSVPAALDPLPIGVQVVGRHGDESTVLRVGHLLELKVKA